MWFRAFLFAGLAIACSSPKAASDSAPGAAGNAGDGGSADGVAGAGDITSCAPPRATCDACSQGCDAEGCHAGECVVQELFNPSSPDNVVDFTVAGDALIWTNASGDVLRSGLLGEMPTTVAPATGDRTLGLAADSSNVYWLGRMKGEVIQADAKGEGSTVLATLAGQPFDLAIADDKLLYVALADVGEIWSVARADGESVKVATPGPGALHVAADAEYLVWSNDDAGEIAALNRATGKVSVVASNQKHPTSVVLRDDTVYWANTGDSSMGVVSKRLPDGTTTTLALIEGAESLALGKDYCYFAAGPAAYRAPLATGPLQSIVSGYERLGTLVTTEHWLYFSDFYRGTIGRVAQ